VNSYPKYFFDFCKEVCLETPFRRRKSLLVFSFCLLCFLQSAVSATEAQEVDKLVLSLEVRKGSTLSLDEAIERALNNNPSLKSKEAEVQITKESIQTAGARQNPFLEGIESVAEQTYSGGINYTFELGGKRRKRIKVAEKQSLAAQKDYEFDRQELISNVRNLYSKLIVNEEKLKAKELALKLSDQLVTVTKKRYEAGAVPAIDIKVSEQSKLKSQSEILELQKAFYQNKVNLNILLALEPDSEWCPNDSIGNLSNIKQLKDKGILVQTAINKRADLQKLYYDLQAAEAQLKLAQANRIPNLQENFAVVTSNAQSADGTVLRTNIRTDTIIELPAFNRQQGPIAEAKAKIDKLHYDQLALKNQIAGELATAYKNLQLSQDKLKLAEKSLKSAEEIAQLIEKGYQAGRMDIMQVILTRQSYKEVQNEYFNAFLELQDSISNLEKAVGESLSKVTL
jgi:outer membrane protein, heavy metal efflux system